MANANFKVKNGLDVGGLNIQASTGDLTTPGNIHISGSGALVIDSTTGTTLGNISISGNDIMSTNTDGFINLMANGTGGVKLIGSTLYSSDDGNRAVNFESSAALTNAQAVFAGNVDDFLQFSIVNTSDGESASADLIVYADNGTNDAGWIDLGMTNSGFTAAEFGITNAGDGYIFMSGPDVSPTVGGNLVICTDGTGSQNDIVFATGGFDSTREQGRFISDDGFQVKGNLVAINGAVYQGVGARDLTVDDSLYTGYVGFTNVSGVFVQNVNDFVQFALKNRSNGDGASTDIICYASDGDNDSGWIDMGITSEAYSDPAFTVTGPGTGYIFMSAPATTSGTGDLLVGTDSTGSQNDIVFFTGGFDAGNERVRIIGTDRVGAPAGVEVYISTTSTSTSTGALRVQGGIGLTGNLNVGGDVNIVGNITLGGGGNTVETETLAVTSPTIFAGTGNSGNLYDLGFVGEYTDSGTKYTGFVKDATDGYWKLFSGISTQPGNTTDFTSATYDTGYLGNLRAVGGVASSSTTTGTIIVTGGVGVSGNVYAGGTFNGTATSAQYADLAENYVADAAYEPGTVLEFGGDFEVTVAEDETRRVAGVVSTAPAHLMNSTCEGEHVVALALTGRVPCKVRGVIRKGDMLVSGGNGFARPTTDPKIGTIIGKALENFDGGEGVIEVVVGRL